MALGEDGDGGVLAAEVFVERESFEGLLGLVELVGLLALGVEVGFMMGWGWWRSSRSGGKLKGCGGDH